MGYIYLRKNLSNGKCYVGQTINIKERNYDWNHLNWKYGGYAIENARKKYGPDGFSFEILRECPNEDMDYWEMYYIKEYNTKKPYGYNSTDGGVSIYEITDEIRKKIGDGHRGKKRSAETKKKISAARRGMKLSEETKEKLSAAHRGKKRSAEAVARSAAKLRGIKLSQEHKAKISAAMRGKPKSPEHIAKVAEAQRGKPKPKVAAALRGRKQSPEHIAKVAEALSKAVQALDPKTLEVVMEFPSTAEAQRQGFSAGAVSDCCRGKLKTHKGLIWRYKENAQE